jgi:CRISPR-associated endonuclease Csn1
VAVLGLDLGSSSIGWALIDAETDSIVARGVRIFPEGVDRDQKGGELSKNETRRVARGMRRQARRRAKRKRLLRKALILAKLLPESREEQVKLDLLNPYALRARAIREKLEPYELGRLLIHLNQRRGFLSNRKADRGNKKEASELLTQISELEAAIQESGAPTVGSYLAQQYRHNPLQRLRGKHTRREMFEREFDLVWEEQRKHHPSLLTDELRFGIRGKSNYPRTSIRSGGSPSDLLAQFGLYGLIFFQRSMYWPKSVVGRCEYDPKQKRCPRADRVAQRFRILQEVNNLLVIRGDGEVVALRPDQREKLLKLLSEKDEVKFDEIRKKLGLLESDGFNLEAGSRVKLLGMKTDAVLAGKKYYGKEWHLVEEAVRNAIVRSLIHDDEAMFLQRASKEWRIPAEIAHRLLDAPLPEGYSSLGRETIERLLPHLEKGLPLVTRDGTPCALRLAGYLAPWERPVKSGQFLPEPPEITNPLVRQALHEVRKLINAIVREYGKPSAVHVELAREVKGSAEKRREMAFAMREREAKRHAVAKRLSEEYGEKPTRSKIDRYLLWQEQGGICIYSGREISIRQLLSGEADVDHILPYPRSLDDSLMNKVVCFRSENSAKGNQTVYEWLAKSDPEKYANVLQRASRLPYEIRNKKRPRFSQQSCELNDFINRQLADTAYITSAVVDYVKLLGIDVLGTKGQLTAELRHEWGLNDVLRDDGLNLKTRDDHRHHAIDAIVVALTDRARLQALARHRNDTPLPTPWVDFREHVVESINKINVSHRVRRKVAGALHEETLYGPTTQEGTFVYRKPLNSLTPAMVTDIRDEAIRKLVTARIANFGIKPGDKGKIPAEAWKEPLRMASGVVVRKVRLLKRDETIRRLRPQQYVKPGSNHHLCIFEVSDGAGKSRREAVWVSMLEAMQRLKMRLPIIQREHPTNPDARFVMSISRGEMFLASFQGVERLVWFKTGASTQGQLYFVTHTDARPDKEIKKFVATANSLKARKVTVDPLGRIRWAND